MAILTYSDSAPLSGFLAWVQQRGFQALCQPSAPNTLELLAQRLTWGTRAESGDSVRMSAFLASGTAVINYGGQWMNDEGEYRRYNRQLVVDAASSPARITLPASAGWYRDAAVSLETGGITGQTLYVTQELGRTNASAFAPFAMLAQGWLTSTGPVSGTAPPLPGTGGGGGDGGCCIGVQYHDIASGDESLDYTITVPAGARGRLVYFNDVLTTSGVAGNRLVVLNVGSASGFGQFIYATNTQGPSSSRGYNWQIGGERRVHPVTGEEFMPLPAELWFSEDILVQLGQDNVGTGDNWLTADLTWEIQGP